VGAARQRRRETGNHRRARRHDGGAIRERVFDPFFTTKEVGRGKGRGLAIARAVADKHGGTLTFDTEPGHGTVFYLRLPVVDPDFD